MFHSVQSVPDRVIATLRGLERACGVRKTQLIACSRARAAFGKLDRPVSTHTCHSVCPFAAARWLLATAAIDHVAPPTFYLINIKYCLPLVLMGY